MAQPPDSWDDETLVTVERPAAAAAPAGESHACLTVLTGAAAGQMYRIPEGSTVIGRAGNAELRIVEEGMSRRHARVRREGERVLVEDLGSVNGTFVNGERLEDPRVLEEGDKIQIGPISVLRFAHHDELDEGFHQRLVAS